MEVWFENGWSGRSWVFDPRTAGLFQQSDATPRHMVPSVDVIEDKDAYHFYFEMPGRETVWWHFVPTGPTEFNVVLKPTS